MHPPTHPVRPSGDNGAVRAFTLIELLVVIAIVAILAIVVVLVLNPAQLLMQARDSNRLSDIASINSALGYYLQDQSSPSLGSSNVVYVSIPDPSATSTAGDQCQGLSLPTLPKGYVYQCASPANFRLTNGQGWIPVNFSAISVGSPLGQLPVDPINQSSSHLWYAYDTNGIQYETTAPMESSKYQLAGSNDVVTTDGGTNAYLFEKGTNLTLEPTDYYNNDSGLVGYWPLMEGTGTIATDYSGNGNSDTWTGAQVGTNGYYSAGNVEAWAGAFAGGTSTRVQGSAYTFGTSYTISAWIDPATTPGQEAFFSNRQSVGVVYFGTKNSGGNTLFLYCNSCTPTTNVGGSVSSSVWTFVAAVATPTTISFYENGALVYQGSWTNPGGGAGVLNIGYDPATTASFNGLINDVRVYNHALSAAQIAALYSGGK